MGTAARPGGNITGQSNMNLDVSQKLLELLKEMIPRLSRVAVLLHSGNPTNSPILTGIREAAKRFKIDVVPVEAGTADEIAKGFGTMKRERAGAAIVAADTLFIGQGQQIAELAVANRIPTMLFSREGAEAGNLMSYGQNLAEFYRRAALYVDKILKGAKPGDLPVEQATGFELVINRKAAAALGIKIPPSILQRADRVIE